MAGRDERTAGIVMGERKQREEEMKKDPRIVLKSLTLTGPDGKKCVREMKDGDSFSEAYWSLALEASGLARVKGKAKRKRA